MLALEELKLCKKQNVVSDTGTIVVAKQRCTICGLAQTHAEVSLFSP